MNLTDALTDYTVAVLTWLAAFGIRRDDRPAIEIPA